MHTNLYIRNDGHTVRINAERRFRTGKSYRADESRKIKLALLAMIGQSLPEQTEEVMVKSIGPMPSKSQMVEGLAEQLDASNPAIHQAIDEMTETPNERRNRLRREARAAKKAEVAS